MLNKINVSVITPTFNRAHTIERTYNSLKAQTFKHFEWIIIDDGSTDNTYEVIEKFINERTLDIKYYKQDNKHKFSSIFVGVKKAQADYICLIDSDDVIGSESIEKMYNQITQIDYNDKYFGVTALAVFENGEVVGDKFPNSPMDCSVFDMRYKYKVRGDKWGISFKKVYGVVEEAMDLKKYENRGFIPEAIYMYKLDELGYKTRFVNENTIIYMKNENDEISLGNLFYSDKNSFGLAENYNMFVNCYKSKFFSYPMVYFRNLVAYIIFGIKDKRGFRGLILGVKGIVLKIAVFFLYFLVRLFRLDKKNYS